MMKSFIICLALLCSTLSLKSQNYLEKVYLKNGSIIKGVVIEQIPNQTLKIQTSDGSIFVYPMDEVAKITKEMPNLSTNKSFEGKEKGYRGFVDFGYSIGVGDYNTGRLELSTSHGYQFNPYFYLGAGLGLSYYHEFESLAVPVFANPRMSLPTGGPVSPFIDAKIGYTLGDDVQGFYFSPSIGASVNLSGNNAINFSVGYTMQNAEYEYYYGYYYYDDHLNMGAITLKLGFEF